MAGTAAARRDLLRQASPAAAPEYVSASEATRLLRIKPQTLYTYVSRGLIRSLAQPNDKRRLYYHEDIRNALARGAVRRGQSALAGGAMRRGGQPVSRLAIELARVGCSFEAAAELFWTVVLQHDPLRWRLDGLPAGFAARLDAVARGGEQPPVLRLFALADG